MLNLTNATATTKDLIAVQNGNYVPGQNVNTATGDLTEQYVADLPELFTAGLGPIQSEFTEPAAPARSTGDDAVFLKGVSF